MDAISLEELFSLPQDDGSPGAQLYLYRLLHLLAAEESFAPNSINISYAGAKKLAERLELQTPEKLEMLFRNAGLGELRLEIGQHWMRTTIISKLPDAATSADHPDRRVTEDSISRAGGGVEAGDCDLEHGLIDGALELITGMPVETKAIQYRTTGERIFIFDAARENDRQGYSASASGRLPEGSGYLTGMGYIKAGGYTPRAQQQRRASDLDVLSEGMDAPPPGIDMPRAGMGMPRAGMGMPPFGMPSIEVPQPGVNTIQSSSGTFPPGSSFEQAAGHPSASRIMTTNIGRNYPAASFRTWFLDLTARELARAKRHDREVSILYIDLDDLGQVNLKHGRAAGDQILNAVASALSRSCRTEDFLWHHGEDEFAVILSETGLARAEAAARRLTTEIRSAAEYVEFAATVSASIGLATFPAHAENVAALFSTARSALYRAKSLGKGKIQAAAPGPSWKTGLLKDKPSDFDSEEIREEASSSFEEPRSRMPADEERKTGAQKEEEEAPEESRGASIVIASPSPLLLAGMRQLLAESRQVNIADAVSDPSRLPSVIDDIRPDLIFADLPMILANDFASLRFLKTDNLACKLIISAAEIDQDVIRIVADFSVDGVILQSTSPRQVLDCLSEIYHGRRMLPDEVQAAINDLESSRRLLGELSERELEVLRLVAEGKSNSQISEDLFITVNTVRFHLANIYQKLSVANRTEAANYYLRQDLGQDSQTKLL